MKEPFSRKVARIYEIESLVEIKVSTDSGTAHKGGPNKEVCVHIHIKSHDILRNLLVSSPPEKLEGSSSVPFAYKLAMDMTYLGEYLFLLV